MKKAIILPIAILLVMATVMAVTTLNEPDAGGNYTSSITVNCVTDLNATDSGGTGNSNPYNVSIWYSPTGGAATTRATTITNTSENQSIFSAAVSIAAFTEKYASYNWSCQADNKTDQEWSAQRHNITIDNTEPVVRVSVGQVFGISNTSLNLTEVTSKRPFEYSTALTDAIGLVSYACNITAPDGDVTNVSISAQNLQYDTTSRGDYNLTCSATDRVAKRNWESAIVTAESVGAPILGKEPSKLPFGLDRTTVALIAVVLGIAWVMSSKKL